MMQNFPATGVKFRSSGWKTGDSSVATGRVSAPPRRTAPTAGFNANYGFAPRASQTCRAAGALRSDLPQVLCGRLVILLCG
ncbi:hypothetical protein MATL_G00236670 [Megalops atlanticus]|uniref:Uncharacterized protein n=1 Tax=Megalops atlanticus TaxID=7932 RepID=A0A9D3PBQ6_MEGAT|nr:hypothetical protein MATL_G00236670 [Megalops atlanticus]